MNVVYHGDVVEDGKADGLLDRPPVGGRQLHSRRRAPTSGSSSTIFLATDTASFSILPESRAPFSSITASENPGWSSMPLTTSLSVDSTPTAASSGSSSPSSRR